MNIVGARHGIAAVGRARASWPDAVRRVIAVATVSATIFVAACGPRAPRALVAGEDACDYCHMGIADSRFGTQVVSSTGKVQVFDSIECLVAHLASTDRASTPQQVWVTDVESGDTWVPAADAGYLIDASVRSPMGRVIAFASPAAADAARARFGGTSLSWQAIRSDSAGVATHTATANHGAH